MCNLRVSFLRSSLSQLTISFQTYSLPRNQIAPNFLDFTLSVIKNVLFFLSPESSDAEEILKGYHWILMELEAHWFVHIASDKFKNSMHLVSETVPRERHMVISVSGFYEQHSHINSFHLTRGYNLYTCRYILNQAHFEHNVSPLGEYNVTWNHGNKIELTYFRQLIP